MKRVLMSDELFDALGASKVEWGEPDAEGFYTPAVYADTTEATLRTAAREFLDAVEEGRPYTNKALRLRAALQQPAAQPEGGPE